MARSVVDNDQWFTIPITGGTLQNTGPVPVEISNAETDNTGIVLQPNEIYQWSDATIYARKAWDGVASAEITYVPFKKAAGGGGGSSYILPMAELTVLGGVKSSNTVGKVSVGSDGTMTYNAPDSPPIEAPEWQDNTAYTVNALVEHNDDIYMCLIAHTSSSDFDADLVGGKWKLIGLALKVATTTTLGGVKANDADGGVSVASDGKMTVNLQGYRKASTAYAVGAIAYHSALPTGWYLECKTAGTSGSGDLTISSPVIGNTVTDGNVTWKIGMPLSLNGGTMTGSILHKDSEWFNIYGGQSSTVPSGIIQLGSSAVDGRVNIIAKGADSSGELLAYPDGRLKWNGNDIVALYPTAAAHNSIYRGKDLTAYMESGDMSTAIANGSFTDIFPGDYIIKSVTLPAITYTDKAGTEVTQAAQTFTNVKWYVAGLDCYLHCGDTETTAHHVLLIPSTTLQRNVKMNPTNDTTGGYVGSDMWTVHMSNWANAIKSAFGSSHVLQHREILSNAIDATVQSAAGGLLGKSSAWDWVDVDVNIPNEPMIYGGSEFGSSFDVGSFPRILPLYALKDNHTDDRSWFWLRAVASASQFASTDGHGHANRNVASLTSGQGGVRPYFLYY